MSWNKRLLFLLVLLSSNLVLGAVIYTPRDSIVVVTTDSTHPQANPIFATHPYNDPSGVVRIIIGTGALVKGSLVLFSGVFAKISHVIVSIGQALQLIGNAHNQNAGTENNHGNGNTRNYYTYRRYK